jgi:hypothetical protein
VIAEKTVSKEKEKEPIFKSFYDPSWNPKDEDETKDEDSK